MLCYCFGRTIHDNKMAQIALQVNTGNKGRMFGAPRPMFESPSHSTMPDWRDGMRLGCIRFRHFGPWLGGDPFGQQRWTQRW